LDPFLGEIRLMSFNFAPRGWAMCAGQAMSIQQNAALFSLLGTFYGGNGVNNFMLPDLRSRVPVHQGTPPGRGPYTIGMMVGVENVTLLSNQIPTHNHMVQAVNTVGLDFNPIGHYFSQTEGTGARQQGYVPPGGSSTTLNPASIQPSGGNVPHSNIQPYLAMNYCIALQGIFPSRN
jgi:microcystin-dependent protein